MLRDRAWHLRRHLRHRHVDLNVGMEVDADHGDAVVGLRFDVLDVVDVGGEAALKLRDDALLHLLRRKAAVLPQNAHDGNVDVGEDVHRHGDDGRHAQDGDQNRHHDEGVGAPER